MELRRAGMGDRGKSPAPESCARESARQRSEEPTHRHRKRGILPTSALFSVESRDDHLIMSSVLHALMHPAELARLVSFQYLGGKERVFPPNDPVSRLMAPA